MKVIALWVWDWVLTGFATIVIVVGYLVVRIADWLADRAAGRDDEYYP